MSFMNNESDPQQSREHDFVGIILLSIFVRLSSADWCASAAFLFFPLLRCYAMYARDAALLLGIAIDRKPLDQLLDDALAAITRRGQRGIFACANPHSLVTAQNDPMFLRALNRASHVVADGIGVTMMVRLLGMNRGERITGHDFFMRMMQTLEQRGGGRVFFFGS